MNAPQPKRRNTRSDVLPAAHALDEALAPKHPPARARVKARKSAAKRPDYAVEVVSGRALIPTTTAHTLDDARNQATVHMRDLERIRDVGAIVRVTFRRTNLVLNKRLAETPGGGVAWGDVR